MLIIGHRGAPAYEPENTLRSFAKAIELGADMVEFDVYTLPSGQVVVFHDRTLNRTTNGSGLLLHHGFRELRKLDAGKGEQIPTLQEVLDLVDHRVPVIIELKNAGSAAAVATVIEHYVAHKGWSYDQFIGCSFHHPELFEFKSKHSPHIRVVASMSTVPLDGAAFAEQLQAFAITPDIEAIDEFLVRDAHSRGLQVYAYTIQNLRDTLEMYHLGVDAVFSNVPDVSRAALANAWTQAS